MENYYSVLGPVWDDMDIGSYLGSGSYGDVWELKSKTCPDNMSEAIKEIQIPPPSSGNLNVALLQGLNEDCAKLYYSKMLENALLEVEYMEHLRNYPEIVHVLDHRIKSLDTIPGKYGWILFVRMERLEALDHYIAREGMTPVTIQQLGIDLCNALIACKKEGILHMDIKPENIFYSNAENIFKLGDFGVSSFLDRATARKGLQGTITYMTPEVFSGSTYTFSSDMYAVGMLLYRILNSFRIPFLPEYPASYSPLDREKAQHRRLNGEKPPQIICDNLFDEQKRHPFLKISIDDKERIFALCEIALKSIQSDPSARFGTAEEMLHSLQNIV